METPMDPPGKAEAMRAELAKAALAGEPVYVIDPKARPGRVPAARAAVAALLASFRRVR